MPDNNRLKDVFKEMDSINQGGNKEIHRKAPGNKPVHDKDVRITCEFIFAGDRGKDHTLPDSNAVNALLEAIRDLVTKHDPSLASIVAMDRAHNPMAMFMDAMRFEMQSKLENKKMDEDSNAQD